MADDFGFGAPQAIDPLGEVDPLTGLRKPPKPLQPQIDDYNKDALVKSLRNTKDWAAGQFSLDEQPNRGPVATVADMGLGLTPGVGQAMAVRDIERARRADDPTGMALAATGVVPWGKVATTGRELIAGQKALKADRGALDVAKGAEQLGEDSWDTAGWFRGGEDKKPWKWEIGDQGATLKNLGDGNIDAKLSDVLHHPELYENYPHLADMKVTGSIGPHNPHVEGGFYPEDTSIDLHAPDEASFRKGLLHEVQHSIQGVEGFHPGTSPDTINKILREEQARVNIPPSTSDQAFSDQQYWRQRGENEARTVEARADFTPEQRRKVNPLSMGIPQDQLLNTSDIVQNILKRLRAP